MKKSILGIVLAVATAATSLTYGADGQVIEFYNSILDHYFITANTDEAAAIDSGSAGLGWSRTGNNFKSGGSTAVCRFYGSLNPGPNSHFYTASDTECASLKQLQAGTPATQKRWNFESNDFLTTPPVSGACQGGTTPVYRAYNNGFSRGVDSNHRITISTAAIQEVVAKGWINEGVVMCAPRQCNAPNFWNGIACLIPMYTMVIEPTQPVPPGFYSVDDERWKAAIASGAVQFLDTSATMTGFNNRPIMFAYFKDSSRWYYTPFYADDGTPVGDVIKNGWTTEEVDYAYTNPLGIVTHSPVTGNCYQRAWNEQGRVWDVNGTGVGTPIPCHPNN